MIGGIALGLVALSGCGGGDGSCDPIAATLVSRIEVRPSAATLAENETVQFSATAFSCDGSALPLPPLTWQTGDAATVSVTAAGLAQALKVGGPVTISAQGQGKVGSAQVTVASPSTQVAFVVQPSNVVAGRTMSPPVQVEILDAQGSRVTTSTASVTIALGQAPGGAVLDGILTVAAVNGVASFAGLSMNHACVACTLTAASNGLTGGTSQPFNVTAGGPAALSFLVQPSDLVAGSTFTPAIVVQVQDAFGNRVTSVPALITLSLGNNPGGADLGGIVSVNVVNGLATFASATLNRTGSGYTLTAGSPGLAAATSAPFDVTAGKASRIAFVVQPTDIAEGTPFSPVVVVEVRDALGNRVTTATGTVTVSVRSASGGSAPSGTTLVGGGARALSQGAAVYTGMTVNVSVQRTLTLRATSSGFANVSSQTFVVRLF